MHRIAAFLACAACQSASNPSGGHPDGGTPDAPTDGTTTTTGQIKILSLTTTASTITGGAPLATETNTITFVAIVTDTKGLDTIAGGQLVDAGGATYAPFEAGTNKGTYTATLTYQQINQITALDFPVGGMAMTLTAKFFDNDANVATSTATFHLACRDTFGLEGACGGACTDTRVDFANCGSCGTKCAVGKVCAGSCVAAALDAANDTNCMLVRSVDPSSSCIQICTVAGKSCTDAQTNSGMETWTDQACTVNGVGHFCSEQLSFRNDSFECGCN